MFSLALKRFYVLTRLSAWLTAVPLLIAAELAVSCAAPIESGIARSNLGRVDLKTRQDTLRNIAALGAIWFRDGPISGSDHDTSIFALDAVFANQLGLKLLAVITPKKEDFDVEDQTPQNGGEAFMLRCGWPTGSKRISRINIEKLQQRFSKLLIQLERMNASVDAFEIGNEVDWICFNGDAPDGTQETPQIRQTALLGYAKYLKTIATIIRKSPRYGSAKIITFGVADVSNNWDYPSHHLSNPYNFIAELRDLNGVNYLSNSEYRIDGIGLHIYPGLHSPLDVIERKVATAAREIGGDTPFWITEWGYPSKQVAKTKISQQQLIATATCKFAELSRQYPINVLISYSYNVGWVDQDGNPSGMFDKQGRLTPGASQLKRWLEQVRSVDIIPPC